MRAALARGNSEGEHEDSGGSPGRGLKANRAAALRHPWRQLPGIHPLEAAPPSADFGRALFALLQMLFKLGLLLSFGFPKDKGNPFFSSWMFHNAKSSPGLFPHTGNR